jgi:hypothetical protein
MIIKTGSSAGRIEVAARRFWIVFALCLCTVACGDPDPDWKFERNSPDGSWVAEAKNIHTAGPGNAWDETYVTLRRSSGPNRDGTQVIELNTESIQTGGVELNWLGKRHLEVVYGKGSDVDFQAVKLGELEISLRRVDRIVPGL